jgi:hypothetical protein
MPQDLSTWRLERQAAEMHDDELDTATGGLVNCSSEAL